MYIYIYVDNAKFKLKTVIKYSASTVLTFFLISMPSMPVKIL